MRPSGCTSSRRSLPNPPDHIEEEACSGVGEWHGVPHGAQRAASAGDVSDSGTARKRFLRPDTTVDLLDDVAPEYAQAAGDRYLGSEQGAAWLSQLQGQPMARVAVTPTWAAVLDFETRFPSALSG
jgi:hypothetical protein